MADDEKGKDPWIETLRKHREAAERMRERLGPIKVPAEPPPAPGIPCE